MYQVYQWRVRLHAESSRRKACLLYTSMMNEALACGTPVIGGYYVDNQEYDYYMFLREGLIQGVGDYTDAAALSLIHI